MFIFCAWNLCNNNCIMCTNPRGFRNKEDAKNYLLPELLERIKSRKKEILLTGREINLTGGEPTIHPQFLTLLQKLRKEFPSNSICFASNGRRLVYKEFTKELLRINNLKLQIVIHSANPKTHDEITGVPGSFQQTIEGLENFFKFRNKTHFMELRVVLLRQNFQELNNIYSLMHEKFSSAERVATIFPEYEGKAEENIKKIKITFEEIKPYIENAIENWGKKFKNFYLYHFPLCTINSKYWGFLMRSLPPDHPEVFFMEKCDSCFYKDSCLGVYKNYVHYFGKDFFSPIKREIKGVRKNSSNYYCPIKKNK